MPYTKKPIKRTQCRCGHFVQDILQMKHIEGTIHASNMIRLQRSGILPNPVIKVPSILSIEKLNEFKEF